MRWLDSWRSLWLWLPEYVRQRSRRQDRRSPGPLRLLLCLADHYEPKLGGAPPDQARRRVAQWVERYPLLFGAFRDGDGRPPRHSFFYPIEEYEPEYLDALAGICKAGFGEVEVHLHHDRDTADNLRRTLADFKSLLAQRHDLLSRSRHHEEVRYAFIHGNWALDNSRPDGRWCGVNNELTVLRETGCYADFTMPASPDLSQTRQINSIYYAVDDPLRPKSHDSGVEVNAGAAPPANGLMMIQGPLLLNWTSRKWGLVPRVENSCLQGNQPPTGARLESWLRANIHVPARPDWVFVKLHTHGASEANQRVLLGEAMVQFHRVLAEWAAGAPHRSFHYVTAREMYNLAKAAEAGWQGSVADARDFELVWNGSSTRSQPPGTEVKEVPAM